MRLLFSFFLSLERLPHRSQPDQWFNLPCFRYAYRSVRVWALAPPLRFTWVCPKPRFSFPPFRPVSRCSPRAAGLFRNSLEFLKAEG